MTWHVHAEASDSEGWRRKWPSYQIWLSGDSGVEWWSSLYDLESHRHRFRVAWIGRPQPAKEANTTRDTAAGIAILGRFLHFRHLLTADDGDCDDHVQLLLPVAGDGSWGCWWCSHAADPRPRAPDPPLLSPTEASRGFRAFVSYEAWAKRGFQRPGASWIISR